MHVLGITITVRVRIAIHHTVIRRTVTATVRTAIHSMDGTIPGLGTVTVGMDIRTIGNQRRETTDQTSTAGARPLFSHSIASVENTSC